MSSARPYSASSHSLSFSAPSPTFPIPSSSQCQLHLLSSPAHPHPTPPALQSDSHRQPQVSCDHLSQTTSLSYSEFSCGFTTSCDKSWSLHPLALKTPTICLVPSPWSRSTSYTSLLQSLNNPATLTAQGLYPGCSVGLACSSSGCPRGCLPHLKSLFKCHLLREPSADHPIKNSTPHPSHPPPCVRVK